jgi:uncharacterized protein YhfF
MAIGVKNQPDLDWRFVSGSIHTVAVGFRGDEPRVVMDILNFSRMSAGESISLARKTVEGDSDTDSWRRVHETFVNIVVPMLRGAA